MTDTQIAAVMAALGHTIRLQLWRMLMPFGKQGLPAGAIAARMSILPSSLSFHLRQMTQAGVLSQRRSSRQIIYAVNLDIRRLIDDLSVTAWQPQSVSLAGATSNGFPAAGIPSSGVAPSEQASHVLGNG